MSLMRSTCFWSVVISLKVRLTALVIEVMVVKGGRGGLCLFLTRTPRFYQSGDRRAHISHRGAYDDIVVRSWSAEYGKH